MVERRPATHVSDRPNAGDPAISSTAGARRSANDRIIARDFSASLTVPDTPDRSGSHADGQAGPSESPRMDDRVRLGHSGPLGPQWRPDENRGGHDPIPPGSPILDAEGSWSVGFLESSSLASVTDSDPGLSLPGAVAQGPTPTASMTILVAFPLSDSNGLGRFLTALSNRSLPSTTTTSRKQSLTRRMAARPAPTSRPLDTSKRREYCA